MPERRRTAREPGCTSRGRTEVAAATTAALHLRSNHDRPFSRGVAARRCTDQPAATLVRCAPLSGRESRPPGHERRARAGPVATHRRYRRLYRQVIQDVRTAIDDDGHRYVKTVPRRGYIFDAEVSIEIAARSSKSLSLSPWCHRRSARGAPKSAPVPSPASLCGATAADAGGARHLGRVCRASRGLCVVLFFTVHRADATAAIPRSVAVLPFTNFNPTDGNDFFAAGSTSRC